MNFLDPIAGQGIARRSGSEERGDQDGVNRLPSLTLDQHPILTPRA